MSGFISHPLVQDLAWSLVHFLWQGLLLGVLAGLGLWFLRRSSAQARYLLACVGLAAMMAAPLTTLTVLRWTHPPRISMATTVQTSALPNQGAVRPEKTPQNAMQANRSLAEHFGPVLPWTLGIWSLGVLLMSVRLLGGWLWLRRLLWREAEPIGSDWQSTLRTLARELGIRKEILLLKATSIRMPMVVGWLEPIVLIPAAALAGMDPMALQVILAHELAHIRRHDYLVNVLQSVVEALLFYHPAVWWLSHQIRIERENCCDDTAVAQCGDRVFYASALTQMEDLRHSSLFNPNLAIAADGGSLMSRIQRLIQPQLLPTPQVRATLVAALAVSLLGAGTALTITEDGTSKERTEIIVRDGDDGMKARLKGEVKIDPSAKDGLNLGEGSSVEISSSNKDHKTRRYSASKEKGEVKRIYKIGGEEKPLDADGEAWLKTKLAELGKLQSRVVKTKGEMVTEDGKDLDVDVFIRETAKSKDTDEHGKKASKRVVILRSGPDSAQRAKVHVLGTGLGSHTFFLDEALKDEEVEKLAQECKKSADEFKKLHGEELKKLKEDAKKLAEAAKKKAEAFRKEHGKALEETEKQLQIRMKKFPHRRIIISRPEGCDGETWSMPELPDIDIPEFEWHSLDGHDLDISIPDIKIHKFRLKHSDGGDPKVESEHLKKEIEILQKRLEKLQKRLESAPKEGKTAASKETKDASPAQKTK